MKKKEFVEYKEICRLRYDYLKANKDYEQFCEQKRVDGEYFPYDEFAVGENTYYEPFGMENLKKYLKEHPELNKPLPRGTEKINFSFNNQCFELKKIIERNISNEDMKRFSRLYHLWGDVHKIPFEYWYEKSTYFDRDEGAMVKRITKSNDLSKIDFGSKQFLYLQIDVAADISIKNLTEWIEKHISWRKKYLKKSGIKYKSRWMKPLSKNEYNVRKRQLDACKLSEQAKKENGLQELSVSQKIEIVKKLSKIYPFYKSKNKDSRTLKEEFISGVSAAKKRIKLVEKGHFS